MSVQWTGLAAVVALLVGGLLIAAPGWGSSAAGKVGEVVCTIVGTSGSGCDAPVTGPRAARPGLGGPTGGSRIEGRRTDWTAGAGGTGEATVKLYGNASPDRSGYVVCEFQPTTEACGDFEPVWCDEGGDAAQLCGEAGGRAAWCTSLAGDPHAETHPGYAWHCQYEKIPRQIASLRCTSSPEGLRVDPTTGRRTCVLDATRRGFPVASAYGSGLPVALECEPGADAGLWATCTTSPAPGDEPESCEGYRSSNSAPHVRVSVTAVVLQTWRTTWLCRWAGSGKVRLCAFVKTEIGLWSSTPARPARDQLGCDSPVIGAADWMACEDTLAARFPQQPIDGLVSLKVCETHDATEIACVTATSWPRGPQAVLVNCAVIAEQERFDPIAGSDRCVTVGTVAGGAASERVVRACADEDDAIWRCGAAACDGRRFAPADARCGEPRGEPDAAGRRSAECVFGAGDGPQIAATCAIDGGAPVDCRLDRLPELAPAQPISCEPSTGRKPLSGPTLGFAPADFCEAVGLAPGTAGVAVEGTGADLVSYVAGSQTTPSLELQDLGDTLGAIWGRTEQVLPAGTDATSPVARLVAADGQQRFWPGEGSSPGVIDVPAISDGDGLEPRSTATSLVIGTGYSATAQAVDGIAEAAAGNAVAASYLETAGLQVGVNTIAGSPLVGSVTTHLEVAVARTRTGRWLEYAQSVFVDTVYEGRLPNQRSARQAVTGLAFDVGREWLAGSDLTARGMRGAIVRVLRRRVVAAVSRTVPSFLAENVSTRAADRAIADFEAFDRTLPIPPTEIPIAGRRRP